MTLPRYDIYGWEPSISPHKLALFRALRDSDRVGQVTYVAQTDLASERKQQGWSIGRTDDLNMVVEPSKAEVETLILRSPRDAVHIFSGVHWSPMLETGLETVIAQGRRFGLMREPRASGGPAGLARLAHSWMTEGVYRRHADFVLAIGRNGPPWFRRTGYPEHRIFPFAYFLPTPDLPEADRPTSPTPVVGYLGRLEKGKGAHLVLDARRKGALPARYVIAGSGSLEPDIKAEVARDGDGLNFLGPLPMADVFSFLDEVDMICAPSTVKDGWCAVVSEALLAGAFVVTTTKVGASICVDQDRRLGKVVAPRARNIVEAIAQASAGDLLSPTMRAWRRDWARARLTGQAGSKSLIAILDHIYDYKARPSPFYAECGNFSG